VTNNGTLAFARSDDTGFSGDVTGSGGVTKYGTNRLNLTGANSYVGVTAVAGGTLELGPSAQGCVLNRGGADIQGGKMVFDYAGIADPATTIQGLLNASYHNGLWDTGQFKDSTVATTGLTLGWIDDAATSTVTVMATYPGDFNLDGAMNSLDRDIWFANAFSGTTTWRQGDANYDGVVNGLDLDLWKAHASLPPLAGASPCGSSAVGASVPEPGTLALLAAGLIGLLAYGWRKRE
jgi:autotransporter-associated beta strand protein